MATPAGNGFGTKRSVRRVFISYSRKDGTDAAGKLHDLLQGSNCEVWLDTERIRGGESWGKDIEQALNDCEVLVAVLTPGSYSSEICRSEQIWALDGGKLVIPVLALPGTSVPIHLRSKNYRRYPEQLAELVADVSSEPVTLEPVKRPFRYDTVPSLPQNHVVRDQSLAELRDMLFNEGGGGVDTTITALAGMGGIGKTVLATALCLDSAVQRAFPDGIAWITVGREWDGDFVQRMREVGRALGEDVERGWDTKLACENRYKTVLREKAALVVVDDVWSVEHLKPLLVDAPCSRFLFTTRDSTVARAMTENIFAVSLLSEAKACEVLARAARIELAELPPEAREIVRECGGLAAAISQIGGSLIGKPAEEWRDTLEALKRADISEIEERLPTGQKSFFRSLEVSFQALPGRMQNRYLLLSALLEDVPAPMTTLQDLWKTNEHEARHTARYFVDRSLASWEVPGDPARGIKLHDLQLDYLRQFTGGAAGTASGGLRV